MDRDTHDVWVIIPVFNEGPVIVDVLREVLAVFPNVVCVDDGSSDGSAEQVASTPAHLVEHPINLGQGAALQTGLRYALRRDGGQFFVTFDADGQHRVEDVLAMLDIARSQRADVVLGSRFLSTPDADAGVDGQAADDRLAPAGGGVPLLKRVVLRSVTLLSPSARRLKLTDSHNGLRLLSRPVVQELEITQNRMAHASEIAGWLARSDWRVAEAPVRVRYTDYSRGKGQPLINGVNILFDVLLGRQGR